MQRKVNLFTSYYEDPVPERRAEINYCLEQNEGNPEISKVIFFDGRPRYEDFFNATHKYPGDINILANADIYFNSTIRWVHHIKAGEAYAITRWEEDKEGVVPFEKKNQYNHNAQARHSQDVWVFTGAAQGVWGDFYIGVPGCDNRIAWEISKSYKVYNPCLTIQCIHKHRTSEREYKVPEGSPERIPRPWMWVEPCKIHRTKGYLPERLRKGVYK